MTDSNPTPQSEQRPAQAGNVEKRGVVADIVQIALPVAQVGVGTYIGAKVAGAGQAPPPPPPVDNAPKVILPPGADHE